MKRNSFALSVGLRALGMLFCIVPATLAIISYFPIWLGEGGGKVLSGFTVILCVVAHVPIIKGIKRLFDSPASYTVWLVIFIAFLILSNIAHEMTVISFVGFLGNLIGAVLFKLSGKIGGDTVDEKRN